MQRTIINTLIFYTTLAYISVANADSFTECENLATTEYEKIYCQIKAQGRGTSLPQFGDFQKNNVSMQYLLLKKDARSLGIDLPKSTKVKQQLPPKTLVKKPEPKHSSAKIVSTPKPHTPSNRHGKTARIKTPSTGNSSLGDTCHLASDVLTCNSEIFKLVTNSQTTSSRKHVEFSNFPNETQDKYRDVSSKIYLSDAYNFYIDQMIKIGLGDSTMSYTKFFLVYQDAKKQRHDFSARFEKMFSVLLSETQAMGIKKRYNNNFPSSIESCMKLNSTIIVCDNVVQNWVYKKSLTN